MQNITIRVICLLSLLNAALLAGCATTSETPEISPAEQVAQDQNLGAGLARQLDAQLQFKQDPKVQQYLDGLATKLTGAPGAASVRVIRDSGKRLRNFGLPHGRIYLSVGLLKAVEFENELAAAIAFELAHLSRRHAVSRLKKERDKPEFFGAGGIFDFKEEEQLTAIEDTVSLLYRAGIDPRGLTGLLSKYESLAARAPLPTRTLNKMKDHAQQTISRYAPLRNPVVRSPEFVMIQKRIARP